jgi:CRISPR-associated endonuclease Cas2
MLKNYAVAVQKSVFETFLDGETFSKMMMKIRELVDKDADSVRVYAMSRRAQKQIKVIGFPGRLVDPNHYFVREKSDSKFDMLLETNDEEDLPEWL